MTNNHDRENLSTRFRHVESGINDVPALQVPLVDYDTRIPPVSNINAISASIAAHLTSVTITWISPADPNVAKYEVWVARVSQGSTQPYLAASVKDSPASFNVTSDTAAHAIAFIRTVMKNGLISSLMASPSATFQTF